MRVCRPMREQITSGDIAFRKAYLGAIVDRIEVDDRELRISGRNDVLEQAVIASAASRTVVRTFVLGNRNETANQYVLVIFV